MNGQGPEMLPDMPRNGVGGADDFVGLQGHAFGIPSIICAKNITDKLRFYD
jgi:hypothetical protein